MLILRYNRVAVERSDCRDLKTLAEAPAAIPSAGALRRQRSEGTLCEPQISAFLCLFEITAGPLYGT